MQSRGSNCKLFFVYPRYAHNITRPINSFSGHRKFGAFRDNIPSHGFPIGNRHKSGILIRDSVELILISGSASSLQVLARSTIVFRWSLVGYCDMNHHITFSCCCCWCKYSFEYNYSILIHNKKHFKKHISDFFPVE